MSSPPLTVYLVTGSNRGLGLGLVSTIVASHPGAFVYAGARDPSKATELEDLSNKYARRIAIVKCVSADAAGNAELARIIKERHGRMDTAFAPYVCSTTPFTFESRYRTVRPLKSPSA